MCVCVHACMHACMDGPAWICPAWGWRSLGGGDRVRGASSEGVSPGPGCGAGMRGRPGNSKKAILPARESFFSQLFTHFLRIVFAFFSHFPDWEHFFALFFAFPRLGAYFSLCFLAFFRISQTGSNFFGIFLAFPKLGFIFEAFSCIS